MNIEDSFSEIGALNDEGKLDLALELANSVIQSCPSGNLFAARAAVYVSMGKIDLAIADYQTSLEQGTTLLPVLNNLGLCYFARGEYLIAVQFDTALISLYDGSSNCYRARARALRRSGKMESAREDEIRATELDGKSADKRHRKCEIQD